MTETLQFLKLGGSLITDKTSAHTPRIEVLQRLAQEIAAARLKNPKLQVVLGHGSGSFGHVPARRYGTRQGVRTNEEWQGFIEVWREAHALDQLVLAALAEAGLPAIPFPASACVSAQDGQLYHWDLQPLRQAQQAGLLPVVYGDVVFDTQRGGTILSTEDLFAYLALELRPGRILLAGLEAGVWADFPVCRQLIEFLTPHNMRELGVAIGGSAATDVTGGMADKVQQSMRLVQQIEGLEVCIFSGDVPGAVEKALNGDRLGTIIRAKA
jgi:isopentenyl phosphate kinase